MARRITRTTRISSTVPKGRGLKKPGEVKRERPFGPGPSTEAGWTEADPLFVEADPNMPGFGGSGKGKDKY
jgi:hypothetical protein